MIVCGQDRQCVLDFIGLGRIGAPIAVNFVRANALSCRLESFATKDCQSQNRKLLDRLAARAPGAYAYGGESIGLGTSP